MVIKGLNAHSCWYSAVAGLCPYSIRFLSPMTWLKTDRGNLMSSWLRDNHHHDRNCGGRRNTQPLGTCATTCLRYHVYKDLFGSSTNSCYIYDMQKDGVSTAVQFWKWKLNWIKGVYNRWATKTQWRFPQFQCHKTFSIRQKAVIISQTYLLLLRDQHCPARQPNISVGVVLQKIPSEGS